MIPALIAATLAVAVSFAIWFRRASRRREGERARNVLLALAPRLSVPERLDGDATLKFERVGFPTAVSVHPGARLNFEVSFRLTGEEAGWFTISSLGLKRAFLDQFGFKDLQVGESAFDSRFEVWGANLDHVREKLRPAIRELLLQLDMRWDFFMRLSPDQLSIRARVLPLERFQAETLVGMAYQILDLLDLRSFQDFVLSKVQEKLDDATRCPVCGTPLSRGTVVRCEKCRAAHHLDCWNFNGLCATFACGGGVHGR